MKKKVTTNKMDMRTVYKHCICVCLAVVLLATPITSSAWQDVPLANDHLTLSDVGEVIRFHVGAEDTTDFKLLHTDGDWMSISARNKLYNISMVTLEEDMLKRIEWGPKQIDQHFCRSKGKTVEECQNYIRVFGKKASDEVFVCGTNAFNPMCRTYKLNEHQQYKQNGREEKGVAKSPFDPKDNSTAVYTDGFLFSATVAKIQGNDPVILHTLKENLIIRSVQHDSKWLNEPNFVGSFDIEDKVYFFFRETAVENINCGKTIFSRVARVCKNDKGGEYLLKHQWTSFFKARLNCSIPGNFPFYFDEIQSISLFSQGNFMSTSDAANRTNMFYAVFSTPQNSIRGSAVCAFRYSDVLKAFHGKFKAQAATDSNWLPVTHADTPIPHPAEKCANNSKNIGNSHLNFIKSHPLMDMAVPAAGGAPLLINLMKYQFTMLAIDFQVHAADNRYYDIMFVGTDDGKVVKAINKGRGHEIETVIIEEIQVFDNQAVNGLKIYRDKGLEKLIVMSNSEIVSIPLHRCAEKTSCGSCVKLQDPYCSWVDEKCAASDRGIQSITSGRNVACISDEPEESTPTPKTTTTTTEKPAVTITTTASPPKCNCTCNSLGAKATAAPTKEFDGNVEIVKPVTSRPSVIGTNDIIKNDELRRGQSYTQQEESSLTVAETAIAIVASIVLSSVLSFVAGYKVRSCRASDDDHNNRHYQQEYYGSLQKNHNHNKNIDKEPRYVNHTQLEHNNSQKQLNLLVNLSPKGSNLPNGNAQTKPIKNITIPDKTYV